MSWGFCAKNGQKKVPATKLFVESKTLISPTNAEIEAAIDTFF
ncbi:hypothetical protein [Fictibacillus arsenicus]|nr:hypothetical protein [Fictibacillus arsenicus]